LFEPTNPLIVQGDKTVLLEAANAHYAEARDVLARFAELEKSPEYIHTYRITPLSLWNAAASGMRAQEIIAGLMRYAKYPLPAHVLRDIEEYVSRYGRVKLVRKDDQLLLVSADPLLLTELASHKKLQPLILERVDNHHLRVNPALRGHIKQALVQVGYPAEDLAGYVSGDVLRFALRA
jgi:DNA excision repair protein ERCC-3